mmetsp:Transcript_16105/g.49917  ORF Transcript_16105/g.49917 Transcript_16105/m.49917 type:complete len:251 (+) Transcript_16105:302-1054(+)
MSRESVRPISQHRGAEEPRGEQRLVVVAVRRHVLEARPQRVAHHAAVALHVVHVRHGLRLGAVRALHPAHVALAVAGAAALGHPRHRRVAHARQEDGAASLRHRRRLAARAQELPARRVVVGVAHVAGGVGRRRRHLAARAAVAVVLHLAHLARAHVVGDVDGRRRAAAVRLSRVVVLGAGRHLEAFDHRVAAAARVGRALRGARPRARHVGGVDLGLAADGHGARLAQAAVEAEFRVARDAERHGCCLG